MFLDFFSNNSIVIFFIIFIFFFRDSLSNVFSRLISLAVSYGDAKGELKTTESINSQPANKERYQYQVELDNISGKQEKINKNEEKCKSEEECKSEGDFFLRLNNSFDEKDKNKANEILNEFLKNENDENEKASFNGYYLYLLYTKGNDNSAIETLRRLLEENKNESSKKILIFWLSECYESSKNYYELEKLLKKAIDESHGKVENTSYIINLSKFYRMDSRYEDALNLLENHIKTVETPEEKSEIYNEISEVEYGKGNHEMSAFALEKAIEYSPDNRVLLFNAAYSQGNSRFSHLAAVNYDTLIDLQPNHEIALNNLGATAQGFGLPYKSIEYYKKAVDKGETLAMANLASLYLRAGFLDEARKLVKSAKEYDNPHENILNAVTEINSISENEASRWKEILKEGSVYRNLIRQYTSAYFDEGVKRKNFDGTWQDASNVQVKIQDVNNELSAEWHSDENNNKFTISLSGTIRNNSAIIEYKKQRVDHEEKEISKDSWGYTGYTGNENHACLAYISGDGNNLIIFAKDINVKFSLILHRTTQL